MISKKLKLQGLLSATFLCAIYAPSFAQSAIVSDSSVLDSFWKIPLDQIEVNATRASARTPIPYTEISKEDLQKTNFGVDLPILLDQTPSVVTNSDAGGGIGYTGMRLRGSDATRINVTVNGIPINDAESQNVFWVNMPDMASSADNIQIQRGVGTSTNGGGAFGASINIKTNAVKRKAYGELHNSIGSFNSRKHTLAFGSGLLNNKFIFEARLSKINSDGYIDRAKSDLSSYFMTATYVDDKNLLRANVFGGKEITYQAWGGVPVTYLEQQPTYNPYTYENEVDNYKQTHYQLHYTRYISSKLTGNIALHYTRGEGYYEQYKADERFSRYGLDDLDINGTIISRSDIIRRRGLDNHFYGMVFSLTHATAQSQTILGGGINQYKGAHIGTVIWSTYAANAPINYRYYDNDADKIDGNIYIKSTVNLNDKLSLYGDLQYRFIHYKFLGYNQFLENVTQNDVLHFINPKAGLNYIIDNKNRAFLSFAMANREPNRKDYTESTSDSRPKHETLSDLELGYEYNSGKIAFSANAFMMYYTNQLVLNGQINDVGAFIRTNVDKSYRAGLELQMKTRFANAFEFTANAALSTNKILDYTEYVDNWDTGGQDALQYKNTDLAFSPNFIAGAELMYYKNLSEKQRFDIALVAKYVSRQYLDNTQSKERSLNGYFVPDIRLRYTLKETLIERMDFTFTIRNVLNKVYVPNGFVYRYASAGYDPRPDDPYTKADTQANYYNSIGLYPQAGINFFVGLNLYF